MPDEMDGLRSFRDETPGPSTDAWNRALAAIAAARAEEAPTARQHRRAPGPRRRWLFPAGAALAAAAAATPLAILLPGNPVEGTGAPVTTDAYVTDIEHALNQAGQHNLVAYARTVYPDGRLVAPMPHELAAGGPGSLDIGSITRWSYRGTTKFSGFGPAGRLVFTEQISAPFSSAQVTTTAVSYPDATWWRVSTSLPGQGSGPVSCGGPGVPQPGIDWPAYVRDELRCGGLTVDGRQWVDGVDAVKMTSGHAALTLWFDPATYLPVRLIGAGQGLSRTDFRWLTPTAARLAQLGIQIPAHFRRVAVPT